MTDEEVRSHAQHLYALYVEMISANEGYVHNAEDHNICTAVCEFSGGKERYEYISYSNPSSLATKVKAYVQSSLIPKVAVHDKITNRGGMQDEHTEVKLLNFLSSVGLLEKSGTIAFFSSRSICKTCASAIAAVSAKFPKGLIFNLYELKAELWGSSGSTSSSASSASASSSSASSLSASSLSASSLSASSPSASSSSASSSSASSSSASSSSASSSSASSWRTYSVSPSSSAPAVYAYLAKQGKDWLERSDNVQPSMDLKM